MMKGVRNMKRYVEVKLRYPEFIKNGENEIEVKIKRTKNKTYYSLDFNDAIILDEKGKDYVLTLCILDYGGGGPTDYVEAQSFIFKANDEQVEIVKSFIGYLGKGIPFNAIPNFSKKKTEAFERISSLLELLGNSNELLDKMKITNETFYSDAFLFLNEFELEGR